MTDEARTHDYTVRGKGWDVTYEVKDGGRGLDAIGWGEGIREGDYLVLANGAATTRYRVKTILYASDPPDMWFADLRFAPRDGAPS